MTSPSLRHIQHTHTHTHTGPKRSPVNRASGANGRFQCRCASLSVSVFLLYTSCSFSHALLSKKGSQNNPVNVIKAFFLSPVYRPSVPSSYFTDAFSSNASILQGSRIFFSHSRMVFLTSFSISHSETAGFVFDISTQCPSVNLLLS